MEHLIHTLIDEFHRKLQRPRVRRDQVFTSLPEKIDVAVGMRRTGKTYFVFQAIEDLVSTGAPLESILYINFEDDRLAPLGVDKARALIEAFYTAHPENHDRLCHLFLDEMQNVPGWQPLARRLFDTADTRLYLTGSSAKLLSKEIASALRGRSVSTEIWPYSFVEHLRAVDASRPAGPPSSKRAVDFMRRHLLDYLRAGGFPEVVALDPLNRVRVLQDYVDVVVFRDVVERHNVANVALAKYLARTLVRSAGKRFTVNKLFNDLKSQGKRVSKNTLYEYVGYFEDAYLCFTVPLWSDSLRKVQNNPQKVYAIDPGLAAAFNPDFSENLGQMFENLVYLDLRRRGYDVYYYLTASRREVDFCAKDPLGRIALLQVCYDASDPETARREADALREAEAELGVRGGVVTPESYCADVGLGEL